MEELIRKHEKKASNLESYSRDQSNSLKAKSISASVQKLATDTAATTQITITMYNHKTSGNFRTFYNNRNIYINPSHKKRKDSLETRATLI